MDDQRDDPKARDPDETRTAKGGSDSQGGEPPMKRLGDFEILRELGRGGMGVVYEARQISLNRRVALKVLPPGLGLTQQAVQRFEREAQAAAKLHHTNIVPVHAIGEEESCHYYAMELIEGQPLSEVLQDLSGTGSNPLMDKTVTQLGEGEVAEPEPDVATSTPSITSLSDSSAGSRKWFDAVAKLISEVADALHYAHGRGVIHRDIKPANLMLSNDGKLCITDFGLARVAQEPGMTVSGSLMGTPAYMSPEQVASGRMKLDHRTDVYSLGAVLYELLSHRRPFPGERREEILGGILTKDPRPPRRFNPRIPLDLETICLKAMEKDPDRRYATAGGFAEDLRQYLQHGLIKARRAGIARRTWKSIRRHPTVATATVLVVIGAVVIGGILWTTSRRSTAAEIERLVLDGQLAWETSLYEESLARADQALKLDPENPSARLLRAKALVHLHQARAAAQEARARLALEPDDWVSHIVLAWAATNDWDPDPNIDGEEHIRALERLAPESSEAYFIRAEVVSNPLEKLELLNRALELEPTSAIALKERINVYQNLLADFSAALLDCERLIASRPRSPQGNRMKSYVLRKMRDYDAAMATVERAIAMTDEENQASDAAWNYYSRALSHGARGELRDAVADFDRALELKRDHTYALKDRSLYHSRLGDYEKGLADAHSLMEINPDYLPSHTRLISALWFLKREDELRAALSDLDERATGWKDPKRQAAAAALIATAFRYIGDDSQALAYADQAIELDPENLEGHVQHIYARQRIEGDVAIREDCDRLAAREFESLDQDLSRARHLAEICKRPQEAIKSYTRTIERAPHWADPYYERGNIYLNRTEYAKAIEDMNCAIERAPAWADPYRVRGYAHTQERRYEEALADIGRAIELEPENANAIFNRANVYFNLERFEETLADLDRCFALLGKGMWGRWMQWNSLLRLGRVEEALTTVNKEIEEDPNLDIPLQHHVQLLLYIGRIEEAMEAAERAVEHSPKNATNYLNRAMVSLLRGGACDQAMADLATAREMEPENPAVKWGAAGLHTEFLYWRCQDRCDADLARELAEAAVQDGPGNAARQRTLGMALYRLGRFREGREALLRSAELQVPKPEPFELFALAMTEWKLGKRSEARSYYDRGVKRMNEKYPRYPGYLMYQEEAAEVLGIED